MKIAFFLTAIFFIVAIFVALKKGRRLLDKIVAFDFWNGLGNRQRAEVSFVIWGALTANTLFAGFAWFTSTAWDFFVNGEGISADVIPGVFGIFVLAAILFTRTVKAIKAIGDSDGRAN
jgi:hypothetical protein